MTEYDLGKVTGDPGKGITSITKTGTSGLVDTYTITYTDNTTTTFTVTNGATGGDLVTEWETTPSDSKVPSEKLVKDTLDTKINKSNTTGLVKNDGSIDTNTYLTSSSLSNYMQKSSTTGLMKNDGTVDTNTYLTSSSLSNYMQKSSTAGLMKNDGTVDTNTYLTELKVGTTSGKPIITTTGGALSAGAFGTSSGQFAEGNHTHSGYVSATKVTSWSSTTSDSNVPSEKLVKDSLDSINTLIGNAISYINQ